MKHKNSPFPIPLATVLLLLLAVSCARTLERENVELDLNQLMLTNEASAATALPAVASATPENLTPRLTETPTAEPEIPPTLTPVPSNTPLPAPTAAPTEEPTPVEQATATTTIDSSESGPSATAIPLKHVVVYGQNLYRISLIYDVNWTKIAAYNGIAQDQEIVGGQTLIIPLLKLVPTDSGNRYTVVQGDTLAALGRKFGVGWWEIAQINGIRDVSTISPGQVLKISAARPFPGGDLITHSDLITHKIADGDSLSSIATHYRTSWQEIAAMNNLASPWIMYVGQILIIPAS